MTVVPYGKPRINNPPGDTNWQRWGLNIICMKNQNSSISGGNVEMRKCPALLDKVDVR